MQKQHHVFLSYSRVDTEIMQRVRDDLRQAGLKVWTDEGIKPGTTSWKEAIEQAIRESEMLVVLMSPDSNNSKWVQREIDYADVQLLKIMPLLVRGDPRDAIPFALAGSQFIDLRTDFKAGIKKLVSLCYEYISHGSVTAVSDSTLPNVPIEEPTIHRNRILYSGGAISAILILLVLMFGAYNFVAPFFIETATPTERPTNTPAAATLTADAIIAVAPTDAPTNIPTMTQIPPTATVTNEPTATSTFTPSPSPTPAGELQLRYNQNTLVVYNRTDEATTILGLEFALISEDGERDMQVFESRQWGTAINRLLAAQCVQVWRTEFAQLPLELPVSQPCGSRIAFQSTVREFWIADWDNAIFEVRRFGILLRACDAVHPDDNTNHTCIVDV